MIGTSCKMLLSITIQFNVGILNFVFEFDDRLPAQRCCVCKYFSFIALLGSRIRIKEKLGMFLNKNYSMDSVLINYAYPK